MTIETLEGRVFPRVAVSGSWVVIRQKGRTDVPPLITIETFEIRGSLRDLMKEPRHVAEVRLQGLQVKIPPGDDVERRRRKTDAESTRTGAEAAAASSSNGSRRRIPSSR